MMWLDTPFVLLKKILPQVAAPPYQQWLQVDINILPVEVSYEVNKTTCNRNELFFYHQEIVLRKAIKDKLGWSIRFQLSMGRE